MRIRPPLREGPPSATDTLACAFDEAASPDDIRPRLAAGRHLYYVVRRERLPPASQYGSEVSCVAHRVTVHRREIEALAAEVVEDVS